MRNTLKETGGGLCCIIGHGARMKKELPPLEERSSLKVEVSFQIIFVFVND